jgi:hypothetical protein
MEEEWEEVIGEQWKEKEVVEMRKCRSLGWVFSS